MAHRRRNRVDRRGATLVGVLALAAGVAAVFAGCEPTGNDVVDVVLTGALAAFVTWAAASAPWWTLVVAAGVAGLAAGSWSLLVVALGAAGLALWIGERRRSLAWQRALSAALTVQVLLRLQTDLPFGVTGLIAAAAMALVAVAGVARRRREVRRRVLVGAGGVAGLALLAVAGLAASGAGAQSDLRDGYDQLQDGLDQLQAGDTTTAAATLRTAAGHMADADTALRRPWAWPAAAVPVVAQHRQVVAALAAESADAAQAAAEALDTVDLDRLTVTNGTIDVEAVAALAEPLARLEASVAELGQALDDTDSPWLVAPLQSRLDGARDDVADAASRATNARAAAELAPAMLGAGGSSRWFVAFTSGAESRAQSGLMGNWAELTITDGHLRRSDSGRTAELTDGLNDNVDSTLVMPPDYHDRYATFGAGQRGGALDGKFWSNVTMPAHGPYVGEAMAQMYELATGRAVDGVIVLDVDGLADLLALTGPVTVDGWPEPLTPDNLAQVLLIDQYELEEAEREVLLTQVSDAVVDALLSGELPPPQELAEQLGPAALEGHLTAWAADPGQQDLLARIGMDASLPALDGRDGLAVATTNASGNKIEPYLYRSVAYTATADERTGEVAAVAEVTLRNDAPSSGLPDYVIGNLIDLPTGTNRTYLSLYSALPVERVSFGGETYTGTRDTEVGWNVTSVYVDVPPGQEVTVRFELAGSIAPGDYELVVRPQPTVNPDRMTVAVTDPDGDPIVTFEGELARRSVLSADGVEPVRIAPTPVAPS